MAIEERNMSVLSCGDSNASDKNTSHEGELVYGDLNGGDKNAVDQAEGDSAFNGTINSGIQQRSEGLKLNRRQMLQKQKSCTELSREEAWLRRRKDRVTCEEESSRSVIRCASDCGERRWSQARARCLRDEDLQELKGCIDLGFCFSFDEDHDELSNTFPALDLYYAINKQFKLSKSKSSPEMSSVHGSESYPLSPSSPLRDAWRISSPGENSQEVKTKLRHWAQLVACSVRQSC